MNLLKSLSLLPVLALFLNGNLFAGSITWAGATGDEWNTTDANWTGDATVYSDGDEVTINATDDLEITNIVNRSPNSTLVDVAAGKKVTFATGIMGINRVVGGPSILSGTLVKNGEGELELGDPGLGPQFGKTDRNQYSNDFTSITINGGIFRYRSRAALGSGTVTLAGGTTVYQGSEEARYGNGNEAVDNDFVLSGGVVTFPMTSRDIKGLWQRNGVVSGPGAIKVTGSSRSLALSGDNTYSGGTTLEGATLIAGSYQALGTGDVTLTDGSFRAGVGLPGSTSFPDGIANNFVITTGKYFNVCGNNADVTLRIGGDISGDGTLNKFSNDSTVILSGTNTYSGGTEILDGTLVAESEDALGTGDIEIASGAELHLDFVGTINVTTLTLDGTPVANGTYGSSSSPAENANDTYFSGLGMINVGPPKIPTSTSLALTAGSNPTDIGFSVTLQATVSGGTPSGTVVFYDGLTELGSDLIDGSYEASISTSALSEGARNVIAQYQGDSTYASSTSSTLVITVIDSRAVSTTVLSQSSGSNPSANGATVSFLATVTGDSPSGFVTFYDRDNSLGSIELDGSGQASLTTSELPPGLRQITAQYEGDLTNKPSSEHYDLNVEAPAGNGKLKVFILAGQSNMEGHGKVDDGRNPEDPDGSLILGGIGSLRGAAAREPLRYNYLLDEDNVAQGYPDWITRDDVFITYWGTGGSPTALKRSGYLDRGFGVQGSLTDKRIGPEYGFGHFVGSALGDEVLIIKTAWGGKSLYVDFRPPSSGGTIGTYYNEMVAKIHETLDNLANYYPDYDGAGYELCGFGWHQGWNDRINGDAVAEYEVNLANLIDDIRAEFNVPNLPFVIANSGLADAPSGPGSLLEAQGNVSEVSLYPDFAGTVTTVDTRPFYYGTFQSPISQGYHWNGNGESYFRIGESMGEAMIELINRTAFDIWTLHPDQGLSTGINDGPSDDPDLDGIVNLLEFVLKSNPSGQSSSERPQLQVPAGSDWHFEYNRNKDSLGVSQRVDYSYNLVDWFEITIPEETSGDVTVTPGVETDHVRVAIPVSGSKGFAELVVGE